MDTNQKYPLIRYGTDPMTDFSLSLEMNPKSNDVDENLQLPEKITQKKGCNSAYRTRTQMRPER